jgi:hypothetical protein
MFSVGHKHVDPTISVAKPDASETSSSDNSSSTSAAAVAKTSSLLALGADLKALLEQPDHASLGDLAAAIERLQGEFRLIAGNVDLLTDR